MNRTPDLLITNELLYRLSYTGVSLRLYRRMVACHALDLVPAAQDHAHALAQLAGLHGEVSGFRVTTNRLFDVQRIGWELQDMLPPGYYSTNWMLTHGNLYAAIQLSRDMVSILLFSIIAVAAFNVVSSLVLVVMDKQGNIAILRTLGATGTDIAWIFVLQGAMIGLVGVVLGSIVGTLGSLAVPVDGF